MDAHVLEDCVVEKGVAVRELDDAALQEYLAQFQLD
jgi:hypothetical protein